MQVGARAVAVVAMVAAGCGQPGRVAPDSPAPKPTATAVATLAAADVRAYVAVRGRALGKVEERVAAEEAHGSGSAAVLPDLVEAEREAAAALGVAYGRYVWARERTARVLALRRLAEDRRLLVGELARTQADLLNQLGQASDPASREFLQAQIRSLEAQVAKLRKELADEPGVEAEVALIEAVRVDLALLHSREEKVQEKLRQLVRRQVNEGGVGKTRGTPDSP
ncbi:MAG: hypothetical protein KA072_14285 [Thermoanaerobaculaceae bacterium]|nr:hypothetical protein [Thermoanaerobaculaceae bacterium]MDI9623049.1 hypothetical protein [Acidobacteriota bacterium]NLH10474.1 hypothetical protein [Holophagae bacterium]HPW56779.1 hypothetical protein [Thermoanaerobaculaceae bacterium]